MNALAALFRRYRYVDIAELYRDLGEMAEDGVMGVALVERLEGQPESRRQRKLLARLSSRIKAGDSLGEGISAAWEKGHGYVQLAVDGTTKPDQLSDIFVGLADLKEREQERADYVREVVWWPLGYLAVAFVVFMLFSIFVLPPFQEMFASFGADLPALTLAVLGVSRWAEQWFLVNVTVLLVALGLYRWQPSFRRWIDGLFLGLPWISGLARDLALSQFLSAFLLVVRGRVDGRKAVEVAADAVGNRYLRRKIQREAVAAAATEWPGLLAALSIVPARLKRRLARLHGEQELVRCLAEITDDFMMRLARRTANAAKSADFISKVIVALAVGLLVVSIYLPIFQIGAVTQ